MRGSHVPDGTERFAGPVLRRSDREREPLTALADAVSVADARHVAVVEALARAPIGLDDLDRLADELLEALAGIGDPADATRR